MRRRSFLIWASIAITSFVVIIGDLLNKIFRFVIGPKLTFEQEAKLVEKRIQNLEKNAYLEKLKEERLLKDKIFVCETKDLKKKEGFPFIDFNLKPALAFNGEDGKPVLISSVCTHLGCTVQNKLNKGRLLCPCHITYFDLETGGVIEGPAKSPLSMIPFVVEDEKIFIVKNV